MTAQSFHSVHGRGDVDMANAVRFLAVDAVERAKSGHPGMPMGMADVATVLFSRFLKFDAADPTWPDRDRFVLSAGHGSMLLYALLYLTGYEGVTLDELMGFRQWGSKTPGHPEYGTPPESSHRRPIKAAADGELKGILGYTDQPISPLISTMTPVHPCFTWMRPRCWTAPCSLQPHGRDGGREGRAAVSGALRTIDGIEVGESESSCASI
jgi:hypothetical protein